jgi:hypothetical protein
MAHEPQLPLDFGSARSDDGFQGWLNERRRALTEIAQKLHLPLGHPVEIWLKGDIRLSGRLELADPPLIVPPDRNPPMELRIDRCTFTPADIEACVRLD